MKYEVPRMTSCQLSSLVVGNCNSICQMLPKVGPTPSAWSRSPRQTSILPGVNQVTST
ncbi:hypothetical protein JMJ77_0010178 [Colletotrichum scovillei]|uniref:Uncharacterized protein n=1 Tax=Colletotrichum scovillei TaxID=1209932 RepID=A0A9P7U729_9PEZI|nr:hypothetical protein JMJ78_0011557 [Colletotrichum scovillei]KAG7042073.1 hypothetical protein JMJ77_0010178 [Colletotrichum scovillei]KAG7062104.1 hypothetical protein JMJ76_0006385 [Colletotrichum scovillei]